MAATSRPALALLIVAAFGAAACDKIYHSRIDVGSANATTTGVPALTSEERERAVSVFFSVANRLGLRCRPGKWIGGMDEPQVFLECRTQLAKALANAFPAGRVTVRYPYSPDGE